MKHFFLSRKTVLTLLTLIFITVVLSYVIPQRISVTQLTLNKWRDGHAPLLSAVDLLGLHTIFTSPWFAAILGLFLISIITSCVQQFAIARQKTFPHAFAEAGNWLPVRCDRTAAGDTLKKLGYVQISHKDGITGFIRHPWGYWGNFLLHLGIVVVIASSLVILLTQQRGLLHMTKGEIIDPGTSWDSEEHGLFTERLVLPSAITLVNSIARFWETDDIRQIESSLEFIKPDQSRDRVNLSINRPAWYHGMKIYQSHQAGRSFYLEFSDGNVGTMGHILLFQLPPSRDKASYNEFQLSGMPFRIKGKYFTDAGKKSMVSNDPLLVLRLYDKDSLLGELPLRIGESGPLGKYRVSLVRSGQWAGINFLVITGMPGIFLGFLIIIGGGLLHYFAIPRELIMKQDGSMVNIQWRAARFAEFYGDEYEDLLTKFNREQ
ncbi:MAG: hypothetical protein FD174_691 [Geobacteraceae bacterium]|nr:MAG: hypothetical protein FD174_691 [Geobacteraceae bacterium]